MPIHADDRLLWIIIGSGFLIAANVVPFYLRYIRTLTEIHQQDNNNNDSEESRGDVEAALKPSTLEKLALAPSYNLRASAVKVIAERSMRDGTRKLLLRDLAGQNSKRRDNALHALWFLISEATLKADSEITHQFNSDPMTFESLTDCLANLLLLHVNGPPTRADNPTAGSPLLPENRPSSETLALHILRKLLTERTISNALSAGLISKWLKHYPFPCAKPENGARREDVVALFKTWGQDDPLMESIMKKLRNDPSGLKELRRHGLTGSSYREVGAEAEAAADDDDGDDDNDDHPSIPDVFMIDAEDTAGMPVPASPSPRSAVRPGSTSSRRRPPNPSSSQAERAVRQRRREAAVYSEGNAPLTQENIFQRQMSNLALAPETTGVELEAEPAGDE